MYKIYYSYDNGEDTIVSKPEGGFILHKPENIRCISKINPDKKDIIIYSARLANRNPDMYINWYKSKPDEYGILTPFDEKLIREFNTPERIKFDKNRFLVRVGLPR